MGPCEPERLRIALLGQFVDYRAAGVGQSHHFGTLVEGFARGVVDRRADDLHFEGRIHAHDLRVAAAHEQAEERESGVRQRAVLKVDEMRKYVSLKVIDLDHRDVVRDGKPLGERHAHQQRTQQSGAAREGDGVDLFGRQSGLLERRVHHGNDVLLVRPRSQFGDHAAVFDVDGLRGDDVRQQHVVAYHGGGCVVARGFDAQNSNIHAVFRFFN